jgi:uncharacterized protein (DUF433 family)
MAKEYIERRDGNYYVAGSRVSLDSIVHAFRQGDSPETIAQNFELLTLGEIYGFTELTRTTWPTSPKSMTTW